jgi:starch phosphorylase
MNSSIHNESSWAGHPIKDAEGFSMLTELALNLRWSWNHSTDDLWGQLDDGLWAKTHNPWVVLRTASRDRIEELLALPTFRKSVEDLIQLRRQNLNTPGWFQENHAGSPLTSVAYFSMEFMLSEALPIYSGGLGNVAGDQLKASSDLGVPVVAVGLLYQQGYFRQVIDKAGGQEALFPYNDPGQLPITPVRLDDGSWLRFKVELPEFSVWVRTWQVDVGRAKLYLLDSNDPANYPVHRGITSELYGGGPELRIQQELLLGIGGWRALQALGIQPEVCHLNEGHAAFAILERARSLMKETGQSFEIALEITRAGNVFTTHTAVEAGFDRFSPELVERYLGKFAESELGISSYDLLAMGRANPADASEAFNMAYLAVHGSGAVNAVSQLHESVSKEIFQPLFPRWPQVDVPIGHVTNGVHMPTWDSAEADHVWTEACGKNRWRGNSRSLHEEIELVSDARLWRLRSDTTQSLVEYTRSRLSTDLAAAGASQDAVEFAKTMFDPAALTLGFARRFATYKRPNLLLHDRERLLRILSNSDRPVQLIIAGKAHPEDKAGQELIREWIQFIRQPEVRPHIAFLSDYDMFMTEQLVKGVDVWINTPRRPWEASGTSGMKVLVNGGINLSELDGWWAEAYSPELGWAIGDGLVHGDDPEWDATEANQLYDLLEQQIIPEFYERGSDGIPLSWVAKMRASMSLLTPRFSADRAVREYTEGSYIPAAASYSNRKRNEFMQAKMILDCRHKLNEKWDSMHFVSLSVRAQGDKNDFQTELFLNGIDPMEIRVELYAEGLDGASPERYDLDLIHGPDASSANYLYGASITLTRPQTDFTARVTPRFEGIAIPLEESHILWQS